MGREIARVLGADRKENGYMTGNGYMVTWTYGNMLSLAMPKDSGTSWVEREDFPLLPPPFLTGNEREGSGDDGQVTTDETTYAVAVGHGKLDEVSECPCHGIAASLEISFLSFCRAHDAGDFTCHGWLFLSQVNYYPKPLFLSVCISAI